MAAPKVGALAEGDETSDCYLSYDSRRRNTLPRGLDRGMRNFTMSDLKLPQAVIREVYQEKCENCRFYQALGPGMDQGFCRRHPPVHIILISAGHCKPSGQPTTNQNGWCGEYSMKNDDEFIRALVAYWEACGPWVPDENLTDDGKKIKLAFLSHANDPRLAIARRFPGFDVSHFQDGAK